MRFFYCFQKLIIKFSNIEKTKPIAENSWYWFLFVIGKWLWTVKPLKFFWVKLDYFKLHWTLSKFELVRGSVEAIWSILYFLLWNNYVLETAQISLDAFFSLHISLESSYWKRNQEFIILRGVLFKSLFSLTHSHHT